MKQNRRPVEKSLAIGASGDRARTTRRSLLASAMAWIAGLLLAATSFAADDSPTTEMKDLPGSKVGLPTSVELVLPGTELEPVPLNDKSPVVVQIDAVYPHGTAFRYEISYYGLEAGEFDLMKYLRRKDGSSNADLTPARFKIVSVLPKGQVQPNQPDFTPVPWFGGYRLLLGLVIVVWLAALIWAIYPRRKLRAAAADGGKRPTSLADRLRPLVARAKAGQIDAGELAQLERALVTYWRRKLSMHEMSIAQSIAELRKRPDAGPLISQLEAWLHQPGGDSSVNVAALLSPYENLSAAEFDRIAAESARQPSVVAR